MYSHVTSENRDSYHEGYYGAATVQCPRPNISIFDGSRIIIYYAYIILKCQRDFTVFRVPDCRMRVDRKRSNPLFR